MEVAEEVKAVSAALAERITQLATELNDKAVRAAERRVAEVTRTDHRSQQVHALVRQLNKLIFPY